MENYCPRGEIQPWPNISEARRAKVNRRPRLNFTEGTIIFYHSLKKERSIFALYTPFIDFFSTYRTVKSAGKSGKQAIEFPGRVPNSAAVPASSRVGEIVKK